MEPSVPASDLDKYFEIICVERDDFDDLTFVESLLERHPEVARCRLPDGGLPLRSCLEKHNRAGCFEVLVKHGAEHDIFTACAANDFDAVACLLREDNQCVNASDHNGSTPLHWACRWQWRVLSGDATNVINLLIDQGAYLEARDHRGETPLQTSLLQEEADAAFLLWERGAEPDLMLGIYAEDFEFMDELLDLNPDLIHWRAADGQSLLHFAIRAEAGVEVIEYLLARGAAAELETRFRRSTPLHQALRSHPDAVEVLVRYGADVNATTEARGLFPATSALCIAIREDRIGAIDNLIVNGANVNELLNGGRNLLTIVKSREAAELLIQAGVSVDTEDDLGHTPLHSAIEGGRRDVAALLIQRGARSDIFSLAAVGACQQVTAILDANPNLIFTFNEFPGATESWLPPDENSCEVPDGSIYGSALHYAVKSGFLPMVQLLLRRGADVNAATTPTAWTPFHDAVYYAIYNDLRDGPAIIAELVAAGADFEARTWGGFRPIDIAEFLSFREPSAMIFDLVTELQRGAAQRAVPGENR